MSKVTVNADISNVSAYITLDNKTTTLEGKVHGVLGDTINGRQEVISEYENLGYVFTGELDCALYFEKRKTTCDYESKGQEINGYLNQGFTITEESNCTLTLDKVGEVTVVIVLDSTTEVLDEIVVNGDINSDEGDVVEVVGTMITVVDEQELLDEGYVYEGVVGSRRTWSRDISYYEYDNKLKTIGKYEREGFTYLGEFSGVLKFSGDFERCEIKDKLKVIADQESEGFELVEEQACSLKFRRSIDTISNEADVYAFFDTTSMRPADGIAASTALNKWFVEYQANNPDYVGQLYILPVYYERYVDYLDIVLKGNAVGKDLGGNVTNSNAASIRTGWESIIKFPPNFDYTTTNTVNSNWVPPTDVLMLAFVDETNSNYHEGSVQFSNQPKAAYVEDHARFLNNLGEFNFFKAVLYPIVQQLEGQGGALILQSMAAIEGKILSQGEISATNTKVDVSLLKTQNPYTTFKPLKELGWVGVYDKTSPADAVFSSSIFSTELNEIILSGAQSDSQVEERLIEGTLITDTINKEVVGISKTRKEYVHQEGCEIIIGDPEYFKDASFTIAYAPLMGSWISYYSYTPNYYINHNDFFQTGLNNGVGGVWSHLLSNNSFQTFYGVKQPWILEVPVKEQMVNRTLKDIEYYIDAKEYSGEYDFAEVRNRGFNKAWVYNNRVNTGELNLKPSTGLVSDLAKYPNTISSTQQEIPYSDLRGKHRFNYFYDRVIDDRSSQPMWKWDTNQIHRTLNVDAVSFLGKSSLDQIKGDWFVVRFQQDERTDTRFEFKWMTTSETIKP